MMDVADIRDIPSLQAVIMLTHFLQSTAKLSVCYSYVGFGMYAAVRMGLHRSFAGNFDCITTELRKRVFWQIRKLDIYVGAMLGLPIMLHDDDIDQEFPLEVDDDCILPHEILPQRQGRISLMAASNVHIQLLKIMKKVIKYIYPTKSTPGRASTGYSVSHARVREIEEELQVWIENVPMGLRPGGETAVEMSRSVKMSFP